MSAKPVWIAATLVLVLASGCAPSLLAPPRLVAASPSAGPELPVARQTFDLSFNRRLSADASWTAIWRDSDGATIASATTFDSANARHVQVQMLDPSPGSYRLHWHAVAARTGAASDGDQQFRLRDETAPVPQLQLSRTTADSGDPLTIVGTGFAAKDQVQVTIGDDRESLVATETGADGGFEAEARVPPDVPFGLQPVAASDGKGGNATAALELHWGGWPPVISVTDGQPGPGRGEVTLSVMVHNNSDYMVERVRVVLTDPPGATFVKADSNPDRQDGATVWTVPTMDRGQAGPFHATYLAGQPLVGHTWIQFRHRRTLGCAEDECMPVFISESVSQSVAVAPADTNGARGTATDLDGTRQPRL
jgi:methionine-rich copper-binding protein CopC